MTILETEGCRARLEKREGGGGDKKSRKRHGESHGDVIVVNAP